MIRKNWRNLIVFLVISILLELVVFNHRALLSLTASNQELQFTGGGGTVYADSMIGQPHYLYVDASCIGDDGAQVPVTISLSILDEGNSEFYDLPDVTIYPLVEKSKYLSVHSYGAVKEMYITTSAAGEVQVKEIVYDARVPWFVSLPRILAVFAGLCLLGILRPGSAVYAWKGKAWQRRLAVAILLALGSGLLFVLARCNTAFLNPVWPYHQQYYQLAVALSQGKVSIDVGSGELAEALAALDNPYDTNLRMGTVPDAGQVWDICYYQGKFYVYFGIVPVLLFYLPYYLLFHGAFPTWFGVFLSGVGILAGVYYLLAQIRRRWFPDTSYVYYLLVSTLVGGSLNLFCAILHADFYYLPILTALCFALWGLGLILSAVIRWESRERHIAMRLAGGGLCLALTAGCRPQFLVGSFLLIPLLGPLFLRERRLRRSWKRLAALALPYVAVAAGLMFYNAIRFGSVFDFGANYNLTTNDMTQRGVNLDRLPDGIFMYLFQPISMRLSFPFAEVTSFYSDYLGTTIRDWTFGGALWTRPVLFVLFGIAVLKNELKQKNLYGFTLFSMAMALVVVMADTEMAGILNRYYTDFLWLLMLPAAIVLFQLLEKYGHTGGWKWILCLILIAGLRGCFYEMAIAFRGSELITNNAQCFYRIKSFFQ